MSRQLAKHWITADEYQRMGEAGIFRPDERLELLEGEIYKMSPVGPLHASTVKILSGLLNRLFAGRLIVSTQDPIRLDDFSEPQPDVALLLWRDDHYRHAHPTPADVLLVIEVADSTVESDRAYKVPLYAKAGIPEVWLVNLPDGLIELYAELSGGAYHVTRRFARDEEARSHSLAELRVGVTSVIG
ncbi:MAG: Uma2 family endonuclease [Pyrinomonadaceae bacterium]